MFGWIVILFFSLCTNVLIAKYDGKPYNLEFLKSNAMSSCSAFECPNTMGVPSNRNNSINVGNDFIVLPTCFHKIFLMSKPQNKINANDIVSNCCNIGAIPAFVEQKLELKCAVKHFNAAFPGENDAKFHVSTRDLGLNRKFWHCPHERPVLDEMWINNEPDNEGGDEACVALNLSRLNQGLFDTACSTQLRFACQILAKRDISKEPPYAPVHISKLLKGSCKDYLCKSKSTTSSTVEMYNLKISTLKRAETVLPVRPKGQISALYCSPQTDENNCVPVSDNRGYIIRGCGNKQYFISNNRNLVTYDKHRSKCCALGGQPAQLNDMALIQCIYKKYLNFPDSTKDIGLTAHMFLISGGDFYGNRTFISCPDLRPIPDELWVGLDPSNTGAIESCLGVRLAADAGTVDLNTIIQYQYICQFNNSEKFPEGIQNNGTLSTSMTSPITTSSWLLSNNSNTIGGLFYSTKNCSNFVCPQYNKLNEANYDALKKRFLSPICSRKQFFLSNAQMKVAFDQILEACCEIGALPTIIDNIMEFQCLQTYFKSLRSEVKGNVWYNSIFLASWQDVSKNGSYQSCPNSLPVSNDLWANGEPTKSQYCVAIDLYSSGLVTVNCQEPFRYSCMSGRRRDRSKEPPYSSFIKTVKATMTLSGCQDYHCGTIKNSTKATKSIKLSPLDGIVIANHSCSKKNYLFGSKRLLVGADRILAKCCGIGGTPGLIETRAELQCIRQLYVNITGEEPPSGVFYYVPSSDFNLGRKFEYCADPKTGREITDDMWSEGEPDNLKNMEVCVALDMRAEPYLGYKDVFCGNTHNLLCQIP